MRTSNIPAQSLPKTQMTFFQLPLWQLAFRSGFLLGTFASLIALIMWLGFINGWWLLSVSGLSPVVWHLHEMLFGFAAMIAISFVLTAVQSWTGLPGLKGTPLAFLVMLWAIARVSFWLNTSVSIAIGSFFQMLWWLAAISFFARLLITSKNRRNYLLIFLFTGMALLNLIVIISDLTEYSETAVHLGRSMVLMFTLLMSIIGGRVIPFFTERGIGAGKIQQPAKLDIFLLTVSIAGITVFITGHFANLPLTPAALMIGSGMLHLIRMCYWKSIKTLNIPLLWSLHLSYLLLAFGLIALGASYLTEIIVFSSALHLITTGAMGLMILAMMSRVSLGHTGRPLTPSPLLSLAFALMVSAALVRTVLPAFGLTLYAWNISALLWTFALLIFLWLYTPMLLSPRKNG